MPVKLSGLLLSPVVESLNWGIETVWEWEFCVCICPVEVCEWVAEPPGTLGLVETAVPFGNTESREVSLAHPAGIEAWVENHKKITLMGIAILLLLYYLGDTVERFIN